MSQGDWEGRLGGAGRTERKMEVGKQHGEGPEREGTREWSQRGEGRKKGKLRCFTSWWSGK